jgi:hypothetical protein
MTTPREAASWTDSWGSRLGKASQMSPDQIRMAARGAGNVREVAISRGAHPHRSAAVSNSARWRCEPTPIRIGHVAGVRTRRDRATAGGLPRAARRAQGEVESPKAQKRRAFAGCREASSLARSGGGDEKTCVARVTGGDVDFMLDTLDGPKAAAARRAASEAARAPAAAAPAPAAADAPPAASEAPTQAVDAAPAVEPAATAAAE